MILRLELKCITALHTSIIEVHAMLTFFDFSVHYEIAFVVSETIFLENFITERSYRLYYVWRTCNRLLHADNATAGMFRFIELCRFYCKMLCSHSLNVGRISAYVVF